MRRAFSLLSLIALAVAAICAVRAAAPARFSAEATLAVADAAPSAAAAAPLIANLTSSSPGAAIEAEPIPATRLLRVRGVATTPEAAATAANDAVHAYVQQAAADATESARRELDVVHADQARARDAIAAIDAQLAALRDVPAQPTVITGRTARESARTTALVAAKESDYRQVADAPTLDTVPAITRDPLVAALTDKIARLDALRAEYVATHAPAERIAAVDTVMAKARSERWTAQHRLAQDIREDYQALASREQVVQRQLASYHAAQEASLDRVARAARLFEALDAERTRLAALQARERDLTAALAATDSGARLVTPAAVPEAGADTSRAFAALLAAGLFFAASRIRIAPRRYAMRPASAYAGFRVRHEPHVLPAPGRRRAA